MNTTPPHTGQDTSPQTQLPLPLPSKPLPIFIALALMTLVTWQVGEQGASGSGIVAFVLTLAVIKGTLVAREFMALSHAPRLWQVLVIGWLLLVCGLIFVAYRLGH